MDAAASTSIRYRLQWEVDWQILKGAKKSVGACKRRAFQRSRKPLCVGLCISGAAFLPKFGSRYRPANRLPSGTKTRLRAVVSRDLLRAYVP